MKRLLYEAPIDDFFSEKAKTTILGAQNKKYIKAKEEGGSQNKMQELMYTLPTLESEHRENLIKLALAIFYYKFPKIKERVDKGLVKMDVQFSQSPGGRKQNPSISSQQINKAKEMDSDFDERIKARNFINATTQGSAWSEGFNSYKMIESQLNQMNPELVNKYKQFENSATVFYNDNITKLEKMAEQSSGRVAYVDIQKDSQNPDNSIIIVRAPHFPLLVHELIKGGRYFNSLLYMPKDKEVNNTLTKLTDTHKHEIRNLIFGREVSSKLSFLWSQLVKGYKSWMDAQIQTQFGKMANDDVKLYNYIMYKGVLDGEEEAMDLFIEYSQMIVDSILKKAPKVEEPDFNKIIKTEKKPETIKPEEDDDDFNPDDWDIFDIDDEDEDK